jgi:hypothetical protein
VTGFFFAMIERKCPNCSHWNKEEDLCTKCSEPISPDAIIDSKQEKKRIEEAAKEPDKFDLFLEKMKSSKYILVRWSYHLLYSVFTVIGAIGAFLAWLTAMANA